MASAVDKVAAEHQRGNIPQHMFFIFEDMSNEALLSLAQDDDVGIKTRTWAGWELEYRDAFEITFWWEGLELRKGKR